MVDTWRANVGAGGCRKSEHTHGAVLDSWRVCTCGMATAPQHSSSSLLLSSLELSNTKEYEPQIRLNPRPNVLKAEHTLAGGCRESEHTHVAVVDSWRVMATTPQPSSQNPGMATTPQPSTLSPELLWDLMRTGVLAFAIEGKDSIASDVAPFPVFAAGSGWCLSALAFPDDPPPKALNAELTSADGCRTSGKTHGAVVDSWRGMATTPQPKTLNAERKLLSPWQVGAKPTPER